MYFLRGKKITYLSVEDPRIRTEMLEENIRSFLGTVVKSIDAAAPLDDLVHRFRQQTDCRNDVSTVNEKRSR